MFTIFIISLSVRLYRKKSKWGYKIWETMWKNIKFMEYPGSNNLNCYLSLDGCVCFLLSDFLSFRMHSGCTYEKLGIQMGWFLLGNGVCLIMKKAPSDSPIWQLKKRELLLSLSSLITKPIKLDLWNLHYGPHYETQGLVIRENNITAPLQTPLRTPLRTL